MAGGVVPALHGEYRRGLWGRRVPRPAPPCPAVPRIKTSRPGVTVPPAAGFRPGDIRIRLAGAQGAEIITQRSRSAGEGLGTGSVRQWVMPPCNKVKCFLKPT